MEPREQKTTRSIICLEPVYLILSQTIRDMFFIDEVVSKAERRDHLVPSHVELLLELISSYLTFCFQVYHFFIFFISRITYHT